MSTNHGPLCRDIIGCNVQIKGKKVIDESGNFKTSGSLTSASVTSRGNTTVCGNLLADHVTEKTLGHGVSISANVSASGLINTNQSYHVNGVQVVTFPQVDPGNANATVQNVSDTCNLILQVLRNHGLVSNII